MNNFNNPEYVKIGEKRYKINTDFRVAIECNRISMDNTIGDNERGLAIIYKLFGDEGLEDTKNYAQLLYLGKKFLMCGKEKEENVKQESPDMDFIQDMDYIEASFMSDYRIDLQNTKMHWWKFCNLINGLSNSEFGNCCILNKIRNIRNKDPKEIKDSKERQKFIELQKRFALKKETKKEYTQEEQNNINDFMKQVGLRKE